MAKQAEPVTPLKEELSQPDAFQRQASKSLDYLRTQSNTLLIVIVGAIATVVIAVLIYYYIVGQREKAGFSLGRAVEVAAQPVYEVGLVPPPSKDVGLEPLPVFTSRDTKLGEVAKTWSEVAGLSGTPARTAKLGEAGALYDLGKYAEARAAYQAFLDSDVQDLALLMLAREGLAYAYEAEGNLKAAQDTFQAILSEDPKNFQADAIRLQVARLHEKQGNKDEAIKLYQSVIDDFAKPDDVFSLNLSVEEAKTRLRALGVEPVEKAPSKDLTIPGLPQ